MGCLSARIYSAMRPLAEASGVKRSSNILWPPVHAAGQHQHATAPAGARGAASREEAALPGRQLGNVHRAYPAAAADHGRPRQPPRLCGSYNAALLSPTRCVKGDAGYEA